MIEKDIRAVLKRAFKREVRRYIKPTAIHVEALHDDVVWQRVKRYVSDKEVVIFALTPVNYEYAKIVFGVNMNKREYEKVLAKRYRQLAVWGNRVQLHLHLRFFHNAISMRERSRMLIDSYTWLFRSVCRPTEIVFGWWSWDRTMRNATTMLGLKIVEYSDYYFFHDVDLTNIPKIR